MWLYSVWQLTVRYLNERDNTKGSGKMCLYLKIYQTVLEYKWLSFMPYTITSPWVLLLKRSTHVWLQSMQGQKKEKMRGLDSLCTLCFNCRIVHSMDGWNGNIYARRLLYTAWTQIALGPRTLQIWLHSSCMHILLTVVCSLTICKLGVTCWYCSVVVHPIA
jgi:hypothetical protein